MADAVGGDGGAGPPGGPALPAELGPVGDPVGCRGGATWHAPKGGVDVGLTVNNTLTAGAGGKKGEHAYVPFVPAAGRQVKWYTCGPTVYDSAHLGHARAYLTFDILRRIMEDYFGYDVTYHVNVTDVDDKIIKRARRNKLIADFVAEHAEGFAKAKESVDAAVAGRLAKLDKALAGLKAAPPAEDAEDKVKEEWETEVKETALKLEQATFTAQRVATVADAVSGGVDKILADLEAKAKELGLPPTPEVMAEWPLSQRLQSFVTYLAGTEAAGTETGAKADRLRDLAAAAEGVTQSPTKALAAAASDELGEALDKQFGSGIRDHAIFNEHARHFEREYMEDMKLLGIRPPDVVTRVTEYIDGIKDFVQKIVDNGLAYESNGSVYLSIADFKKAGHHYRKLKPGDTVSAKEMAEGEGDLAGDGAEKRHPNDFALWKASKPGEPEWDSPWGKGRPGWHIECSAIASDVLGPYMDVHAGGVDLAFPHHDNELAQSEACFGHHQWVSYFFHAGHLHIKGLKMSKSLKNFITIRQALAKQTSPVDGETSQTTARHIRLMFLMQAWDKPMDYSDNEILNAKRRERKLRQFFADVKRLDAEDWLGSGADLGWTPDDRALNELLLTTKRSVHAALCRNFNTKEAMLALDTLIGGVNKALGAAVNGGGRPPAHLLVRSAGVYVTKILRTFGVVDGSDDIGFGAADGGGAAAVDREAAVKPFVDTLVDFRDEVRGSARAKADPKAFLVACDRVRDEAMVKIGVKLTDSTKDGVASTWSLVDPEVLRQEMAEKRALELQKQREKKLTAIDKKEKALEKALSAQDVSGVFDKATFSEFDKDGVPTKELVDGSWVEIAKNRSKKLKKQLEKAQGDHKKLQDAAKGDVPKYIASLEAEIADLKASLQ